MIDKNSIEQAYSFFHQKWNVYAGKSSEVQKDDIEYAISSYADTMSEDLYDLLSGGDKRFLREHPTFAKDIQHALMVMESALEEKLLRYTIAPEIEAFSTMRDAELPYPVVQAHQVHGTRVAVIDRPGYTREELEGYDALITNVRGCAIGARTADCIPIVLYDPVHQAVAAVHSGWRGTVNRISSQVILEMAKNYGTKAADLKALIGPGIGPDAFQVGEEVALAFKKADFPMEKIWSFRGPKAEDGTMSGGHHIDLWEACRQTLIANGVAEENIQCVGICTWSGTDFYSARREGISCGRIITSIKLL